MAVEKVKIKDRLYDVISYEEYTRHPDNYGKFNAVKEGEYVYIPADTQKMYDELKKWVENYSGE